MTQHEFETLIDKLARKTGLPDTTNPFSYEIPSNAIRRENLLHYLLLMAKEKPKVIMVSEAPGYLGMKLTGVPFASERTLKTHPFFQGAYRFATEYGETTEQSATIVWKVLDELQVRPLMFPAFPFHPHAAGKPDSNRTPRASELAIGEPYLRELIALFNISQFLAIGKKAEQILLQMGYKPTYVRHPANGGAKQFAEGMRAFFKP